jgi:hypothetical protein
VIKNGGTVKNNTLRLWALALATLVLAAACRISPLFNVRDSSVPVPSAGRGLSLDQVTEAIVQAGVGLGWDMRVARPGQIVGTLNVRSHTAVVDIPYSTKSYSITYSSSQNLKYDEAAGTIHSNYNGWIQNLDNAIRGRLSAAGS